MKTKMGRPKLKKGTATTVLFAIKIPAIEAQKINEAVKKSGMAKPAWARKALMEAINEKISGVISSQPEIKNERINFLLTLDDGSKFSCLSGAGTNFEIAKFIIGHRKTLFGSGKDFISGENNAVFIFNNAVN